MIKHKYISILEVEVYSKTDPPPRKLNCWKYEVKSFYPLKERRGKRSDLC